ncbi:MAG: hypothetical protein LC658_03380, partial [Bacteroidales bacterium]|nr:hypothetical protein [Bacteroidales bacterium]
YAQADSTNRKMSQQDLNNKNQNVQNYSADDLHPDGVLMQNGKVMVVKNGKKKTLDQDMTMNNGTKIMCDGNYIKEDGTKTMMKEGEHMDMEGKMNPMKTNKDKNMYLVPDSTRKRD